MSIMLCPCIDCVSLLMYLFILFFCVLGNVCELFGETIRNVFGYGSCFVSECYGCV